MLRVMYRNAIVFLKKKERKKEKKKKSNLDQTKLEEAKIQLFLGFIQY